MEINLQDMTIVLNGVTEDIYALAKTISTKNLTQVVELLNETNNGLPRVLKARALRMVLNEFVKIGKELPITTELLHRLNWYTEYSDYQVTKLFVTLANCGDARFNENASIEKYKISFWILVLVNVNELNITEDTINKLTSLESSFANFDEYNALLNGCLYEFDGGIDVVPAVDFSRVMFKSSTVVELRELASGYEINVPKRLNRAQLLETIVERLKEDDKYDDAIHAKIKDMKVVSLQRFAKDNNIKASTELKKEAVIDFIVKAVENNKTNIKTLPKVELIVLEEERFEMKPEYIREIDSRYFYEFDEDGEIVSMSDAEDLKAQIEKLRAEQAAEQERLDQLRSESDNISSNEESNDEYEKRVSELERQIELLANDDQKQLLAEQEARLQEMFNERIREMMENTATETEETVVVEETVEPIDLVEEVTEETVVVVEEEELEGNLLSDEELAAIAEREAQLAAELAEKEAELAAKEAELAELPTEYEEVTEQTVVVVEEEIEGNLLSDEELAALNEKTDALAAELAALRAESAELAARNPELTEEELAEIEAQLAAELAAKEAELAAKEAELATRENAIAESLAAKEAELAAKEAELAAIEAELPEEITTVEEVVTVEEIEGNLLSDEELAARDAREAELLAILAAREAELAEKEAQIDELHNAEPTIEYVEVENNLSEEELAAIAEKEAELAEKEAQIAAREAELAEKEAQMQSNSFNSFNYENIEVNQPVVSEELVFVTKEEQAYRAPTWDELDDDGNVRVDLRRQEPQYRNTVQSVSASRNQYDDLGYVDKYDHVEELTPVAVNEGKVEEVTFVEYDQEDNFSDSLIKNSVQLNEEDHMFGQVYNETTQGGVPTNTGYVDPVGNSQELQEEMMRQHQEYLRNLEKQQMELDQQNVEEVEEEVEETEVVSTLDNTRLARFDEMELLINNLTSSGEIPLDQQNSDVMKHLNNYYGNQPAPNTGYTSLNREPDYDFEDEFNNDPHAIDINYGVLDKRQTKAASKIEKLKKKKAKLQKYKTMKDSKVVRKYRAAKRNKVIKRILLLLVLIALYLFVSIGGVHAYQNDKVLWSLWKFKPTGTFAETNEKILNIITASNYDKLASVIGQIYDALHGVLSKFL